MVSHKVFIFIFQNKWFNLRKLVLWQDTNCSLSEITEITYDHRKFRAPNTLKSTEQQIDLDGIAYCSQINSQNLNCVLQLQIKKKNDW